jgi:hypothetical protein
VLAVVATRATVLRPERAPLARTATRTTVLPPLAPRFTFAPFALGTLGCCRRAFGGRTFGARGGRPITDRGASLAVAATAAAATTLLAALAIATALATTSAAVAAAGRAIAA